MINNIERAITLSFGLLYLAQRETMEGFLEERGGLQAVLVPRAGRPPPPLESDLLGPGVKGWGHGSLSVQMERYFDPVGTL